MRATATSLENNRVKLSVEVDEDEMSTAIDRAAKSLASQISVKGFRKGKVPKSVLIAHLGGPAALRSEAIRDAVPDFYAKAVADTAIDPIADPSITVTAGEEEGNLQFDAEVEVRPEVEISGYGDLRVTLPSPQVTDVEVDAQIDRFRETDATLSDVDRPIVTGDLVTMDVTVSEVGSDAEPLSMSDYMYTVGSGTIIEGVDELILGLRAGEDLVLNGSPAAGQTATYQLRLKQVQERILPELTDAWVEESTEWATVTEMRDQLIEQMRSMKVTEAQFVQRDASLVALSELVAEDLVPEALVNSEVNERLHDLGHRLDNQKMSLETFLQVTNQTPDTLLDSLRADARRAVRVDLALRALARAEGLQPSDEEIEEELARTAESLGVAADVLRQNLHDTGRSVAFAAEVAKMKASRWLLDNVTYVDALGVVIDRELLRAEPPADA